jgi:hypothetical protein
VDTEGAPPAETDTATASPPDESGDSACTTAWYADADDDGYGDAATHTVACDQPEGHVLDATDCDDASAAAHPNATEVCGDGLDNDCDGLVSGCGFPAGEMDPSSAEAKLLGEAESDAAGSTAAFADVNGDGFDDVLIGAKGHDAGDENTGAVYVVHGPVWGERDLADASATLLGTEHGGWVGEVAGCGDVDGDGFDEALVGGDYVGMGAYKGGVAYYLQGPLTGDTWLWDADARLYGTLELGYAGSTVAGVGDVDADGADEFMVGSNASDTWLILGPITGERSLDNAHVTFDVRGYTTPLGPGDVDGDGVDDVLIGTSVGEGFGVAYLYLGPFAPGERDLGSADAWLRAGDPSDFWGSAAVGAAGDVNADGYRDLLVGGEYADNHRGPGKAWLVYGPPVGEWPLTSADATLWGDANGDGAGSAVEGAGDLEADGYDDFYVAAWRSAATRGSVYVVHGPVTGSSDLGDAAATIITGENDYDYLGLPVGRADYDGDTRPDLLVGAEGADANGTSAGAAWLFYNGDEG